MCILDVIDFSLTSGLTHHYKTCSLSQYSYDAQDCRYAGVNVCQSVSAFSPVCFVIQLLRALVFPSFLSFCQISPSFLLQPSVLSDSFISPTLRSSSHLSRKKGEEEREYTSRKLLSHTVQEGDSMSKIKQCSLAAQ